MKPVGKELRISRNDAAVSAVMWTISWFIQHSSKAVSTESMDIDMYLWVSCSLSVRVFWHNQTKKICSSNHSTPFERYLRFLYQAVRCHGAKVSFAPMPETMAEMCKHKNCRIDVSSALSCHKCGWVPSLGRLVQESWYILKHLRLLHTSATIVWFSVASWTSTYTIKGQLQY